MVGAGWGGCCLLIRLKPYWMRESGAQGQGAGDFNLGGEAGEVGALKCGVLGNQSEGENAGRRDVLAGGCHGDEVFLGREQAMVQPMMVQPGGGWRVGEWGRGSDSGK